MSAVGERLATILESAGVGAVFGVPGGQTLPFYQGLESTSVRHVLMRDERNAATAADAYARLTGTVGFCDATVGPGATNLVTGLAEAFGASIPVVALIADISTHQPHLRRRAIVSQAIDQHSTLQAHTKWLGRVERPEILDEVVAHALRVATTGRPGPVVVEIPDDVFRDPAPLEPTVGFTAADVRYPRYRSAPLDADVAAAVAMIRSAARPVILAGGGVTYSGAAAEVTRLAERSGTPVVTTISGKGTIDEGHRLAMGVTGVFGSARANRTVQEADLVVAVGCKMSQPATHSWQNPSPAQRVIRIDVDGEEIGRTGPVALAICADAATTARLLADRFQPADGAAATWTDDLAVEAPEAEPDPHGRVAPDELLGLISEALGPDDVLVSDASYSSGWSATNFRVKRDGVTYLAPRGLAGTGWAAGASIGARIATDPSNHVVTIAGDGGWAYGLTEVETACRVGLNVVYVILNNAINGWIKHIQERMGAAQESFGDIDFAGVARAMGASGATITHLDQVPGTLAEALERPGPTLLDVKSSIAKSPIYSLPVRAGIYG
jgi:acetolactate synthase-1/2/3 large subunit